jgi:ElaB/YqjD/DUF883 family membrane-anchored ribosome-binding protein
MDNSTTSGYVKNGHTLADKAADKVQSGIRDAQHSAKEAGAALSNKVDDLRSDAAPALAKVAGRAQSMGRQSIDTISDMAGQARDAAANASDSIVAYTKKNPVKALAFAAASGALLYAAIKALTPSRD